MARLQLVTVTSADRTEAHEYLDATVETTVDRAWAGDDPDGPAQLEEHGLVVHLADGTDAIYPYGSFSQFRTQTVDVVPPDPDPETSDD